ncbi:MAG: xylulokinase [Chloroflexaceae bacterium]|jgi:xylulokinase|nr:xylulokinase [Chloroflexaceae bacterium]
MFIGIDLGTSSLKVVVVGETGQLLSRANASYPLLAEKPGQAEQHPDDWWTALVTALRQALAASARPASAVRGLGLSGQMHGIVPLDATGVPLRRAMLWADQRGEAECRQLEQTVDPALVLARTGSRPAVAFSAVKLLWLRAHEPETFARVAHVLQPKDYLRLRLTGELATDPTDASGTLLFDLARRGWWQGLLEKLNLSPALLPPVRPSSAIAGQLTAAAAAELGLPVGLPVATGAGDTAAQALAYGATRPGVVLATISSGGQLVAPLRQPQVEPGGRVHTFCHVEPGLWYALGAFQSAGLALRWLGDLLGANGNYDDLIAEATAVPPGADGLIFLPYLLGERTPHLNNQARAVFFGLTLSHGRAALVRAVLEGVAYAFRDGLAVFYSMGLPVVEVRLGSGGARSPLWRSIFADVLGLPVRPVMGDDGAAMGAAMLAAAGVDRVSTLARNAPSSATPGATVQPDPANRQQYDEGYRRYRELYPSLQPHFAQ